MATYITAVVRGNKTPLAEQWFHTTLSKDEFVRDDLKGASIFCASARASIHDHGAGSSEFSLGHLVDHPAGVVRFPPFGNKAAGVIQEGTFIHVCWNATRLQIRTDAFGLVPVYHFVSDEFCVFSDSLLVISNLMRATGVAVKLDSRAFISRAEAVAITGQTVSTRSFIEGVKYAPPGTRISIDIGVNALLPNVRHEGMPAVFAEDDDRDYYEQIASAAREAVGYVGAMMNLPGTAFRMDLSGGMDSRLCLAFAMKIPGYRRRISIGSSISREADYAVASSICRTLDLRLNPPRQAGEVVRTDRLATWAASCAGIYDPIYCPPFMRKTDNAVLVGGHGAEVYKGQYGWRPIAAIGDKFDPEVREIFRQEVTSGLAFVGIDRNDPFGSEWHYLGWRSGIHGGRFTMTSSRAIRPILSRKLVGLSRLVEADPRKRRHRNIIRDMLISLSPELAAAPFADALKWPPWPGPSLRAC